MAPRASLVIPLLQQRDEWLHACVASALAQTVETEVIVVTSSRTPASNHAVLDEAARGSRGWLRVVERPASARFAGALNHGFARATCDRVGLLLTDDWLAPDAVETSLEFAADIVSSRAEVFDADGVTRLVDLDRTRQHALLVLQPTVERKAQYLGHFLLLRRAVVQAVGGVDETVGDTPGVDDYHLLWTMLERGATAAICERPLYNYRDHEGERLTNREPLRMLQTMSNILARHHVSPEEHERLLYWHARWFGRPLQASTAATREQELWALGEAPGDGVDPRVSLCLSAVSGSATLESHAEAAARAHGVVGSTALAAMTEAVCRGLLVRVDRGPSRAGRRPPSRGAAGRPTTLAIVTCGDPELAGRAMRAWHEHTRGYGEHPRLLVADDSREAGDADAIARHAADVRSRGAHAELLGIAEKRALIDELSATAGVARDVLEFALLDPLASGYTLGANLNGVLLATAGEAVASVDQDIEPTAFGPRGSGRIELRTGDVAAKLRWFVDDAELEQSRRACDVLEAHGQWLGRPVDARIGGYPAHIVASWIGVAGGIGFSDAAAEVLIHADAAMRDDASRLASVLARPRAMRCPDDVTITDGPAFTSAAIALDNRGLLPPFFPVGRGIDLVFGAMTRGVVPGAMFAELPLALTHERMTAPRDPGRGGPPLWLVLTSFVSKIAPTLRGDDTAARIRGLGAAFEALATAADGPLAAMVHGIERARRHIVVTRLEAAMGRHAAGPHLLAAIRAQIEAVRGAPLGDAIPPELAAGGAPWPRLRALLRGYGQLLLAWPRIMAVAQQRPRQSAA